MTAYGQINGPNLGIVMKELVRRAIGTVKSMKLNYEVTAKEGYDGGEDLFTSADVAAQGVYVKSLREIFPLIGIVGEEADMIVHGWLGDKEAFFVLDPIDGTKAFVRGQSHGVSTMIALVVDGVVVASFIGDINTDEIYGFRPESDKVHRISQYEQAQHLVVKTSKPLHERYVLLRERTENHTEYGQALTAPGGAFKNLGVTDGSIGMSMARIWTSEMGAAILMPGKVTLWDMCPIWGISLKLGFVFLRTDTLEPYNYRPTQLEPIIDNPHELLVIHHDYVPQLLSAYRRIWN